jgi:hypothetical protein
VSHTCRPQSVDLSVRKMGTLLDDSAVARTPQPTDMLRIALGARKLQLLLWRARLRRSAPSPDADSPSPPPPSQPSPLDRESLECAWRVWVNATQNVNDDGLQNAACRIQALVRGFVARARFRRLVAAAHQVAVCDVIEEIVDHRVVDGGTQVCMCVWIGDVDTHLRTCAAACALGKHQSCS